MIVAAILFVFGLFMLSRSIYIVSPGQAVIHMRVGRILSSSQEPGLYFKVPFWDSIVYINTTIQTRKIETESLSHDLQFIAIGVAVTYKITDVESLYRFLGRDWENKVLIPCAQESIKAMVAEYTAEDIIQSRHQAKGKVFEDLKKMLIPYFVELVDFNFIHLDFHKDFINAVEKKQIAMQAAMTARNFTEQVKQEAMQMKERAEAEAYAMNVKKQSISIETIMLSAIEKWDGKLPQTVTPGFLSFLDPNTVKKSH